MPKTSARLLALLSLLQARRDWPGTLLADRLDISLRTVRRDVDRLRELGYPIAAVKGPDGGYRLSAGTELPPLLFDDEQAVALTIALQVAATSSGDGLADAAARALNTIRQVMPARLRRRVEALQVTAVERPTTRSAAPVDGDVLLAISAAVHAREILRFDYDSPATDRHAPAADRAPAVDRAPRRVEPHHVVTWDGRWYLVAWDLDRAAWRTFRVDRIALRTPNGPRFTPRALPGDDVASYIIGKFRGSSGNGEGGSDGGGWPCQGTVILDRPAAAVALYTREGVVEDAGSGRCRLTLGSWSWPSLAAAIARFDADIEVVGPGELTDAFAHLAGRFTRTATAKGPPT
ncbi:helix-turn-helix transcriptional regulator [Actinoplanes derwentensis]|uniref:Predicted DNA-binding transcriptional regulator YafY, contains an HTH and WYL domains n=1 Tax=Actinoplanes derwentensis TaxID=113562 RepID=A0A1H2D9G7_9ACTN|nr:WYL domain-containing protein [Actinoplanes derwentensis]GID81526.1 DeoR family transcriptional regulator [Actinoplanes derwentensis]SDT79234.1 Predicted DNA-binding transcriptional regulator YafY, contains an HTH and WYL domains [Actinoplanes derwentensis]